jgi:hypothetical protein
VGQAPGWYTDPFHRGQERYWDGRFWTQGARPESEAAAPKGAGLTKGAGATTDPGAPTGNSAADQADARLAAAFAAADSGPPEDATPSPPLSFAPLGAPVRPPAKPPRAKRREKRRARKANVGVGAVALLLVGGGVGAALVLGGSGGAAAQEAVANAAAQTMSSQSADMSLSVDVSVLGINESVTANGAFDFAQKTGTMSMTIPVDGSQYSTQEIIIGSTVYVNVSGLSGGLAPSKPWISESVDQSNSSGMGLGTLDPTTMLQQLQTAGGTVTSLGLTTYDGTAVTEYAATLPSSAMMGDIGNLPPSWQQGVSGLNLPDMHMNIYVTQDNLLKALELPSYSVSFSGQSMSMDMKLVLSNYGTPVNVTPPPADEVQPLSSFGGGLGNSGSTGTTGSTGSSI